MTDQYYLLQDHYDADHIGIIKDGVSTGKGSTFKDRLIVALSEHYCTEEPIKILEPIELPSACGCNSLKIDVDGGEIHISISRTWIY